MEITKLRNFARIAQEKFQTREDRLALIDDDIIKAIEDAEPKSHLPEEKIIPSLENDQQVMHTLTGLTFDEFDHLYSLTFSKLELRSRGKQPKLHPRDVLFILINYLKTYPRYEEGAVAFGLKVSTYQKIIQKSIINLSDFLSQKLITLPGSESELPTSDLFTEASYIVDATVQQINVPMGSFDDKKKYFSGKHYEYCLKSQVICDLKGCAVHVVAGKYGSIHDLTIFKEHLEDFKNTIVDKQPKYGAKVLADKGYIDKNLEGVLITPFKGNSLDLTDRQKDFNFRLGKERIRIENYFGRLKMKFHIIGSKYRGDFDLYPKIFTLCCALVNFDIRNCGHYLKEEDGYWYIRFSADEVQANIHADRRKNAKKNQQRIARLAKFQ